jgi:RNA polymerase sigma factor (sigma-70 family)
MTPDSELLRRYAESASEDAFAELVQRHIGLVYSAALRQLNGDVPLAQDVTQSVFTDLARKAASLSKRQVLTGWLYTSTHFAATKAIRTERRRQTHELEAHSMHELLQSSATEPDWSRLQPLLDGVMHEMSEGDREAILLRHFEGQPFAKVGEKLGLNENAARMRVDRALEKLRSLLAKRGVTFSAGALATLLTAQAVSAAPTGLAISVASAAIAGAAATGTTLTILPLMSMTKLKIAVASALVVAGASTPILLQQQTNEKLRTEIESLRQQAQVIAQLREENKRLAALKVDADELERLKNEHLELMRLRGQAAVLRQREQELAQAQAELRRVQSVMAAPASSLNEVKTSSQPLSAELLKPAIEWNNVGLATPASAFETWNWAKARGDAGALAKTVVLDAGAKARANALLASLPESIRAKYESAEQMMAVMQMNTKPIVAARVSSQEQLDSDNVIIHTEWQYAEGQLGQNDWRLHRDNEGWRVVISEGLVDKLGKGLRLGGLTSP